VHRVSSFGSWVSILSLSYFPVIEVFLVMVVFSNELILKLAPCVVPLGKSRKHVFNLATAKASIFAVCAYRVYGILA